LWGALSNLSKAIWAVPQLTTLAKPRSVPTGAPFVDLPLCASVQYQRPWSGYTIAQITALGNWIISDATKWQMGVHLTLEDWH
jgi:hypothetical protein